MANRFLVTAVGLVGLYAFFQFWFVHQNASAEDLFKKMRQGQTFTLKDATLPIGTSDTPAPTTGAISPTNPSDSNANFSVTPAPLPPDTSGSTPPASPDATASNAANPAVPLDPNAAAPATPATTPDNNTAPMTPTDASNTAVPATAVTDVPTPPPAVVDQVVTPAGTNLSVPIESSAIVLGYHQFVGPSDHSSNVYCMKADEFDREMKYLKDNNYNVVPLSDIVAFVQHQKALPARAVAITIDDGYKSPVTWAAPILKKYGFPWTFFVYPDFISAAKIAASWQDLLNLQADGVDIECHSYTHPILTKKGSKTPEQYDAFLTKETATAKQVLEAKLGKPVIYFAYPYGDYNKVVEAKTVSAGFQAIFTVAGNPVHSSTPIYSIGRFIITKVEEKSFAGILREGALSLSDPEPAPGSVTTDPRPSISAILTYFGKIKPNSVSAEIKEMGGVKSDFDPATNTVRLYLQHDLVRQAITVTIHAQDSETGQHVSQTWRFNYEPTASVSKAPAGADLSNIPQAPIAKPGQ